MSGASRNITDIFEMKPEARSGVRSTKMAPSQHEEEASENSQSAPEDYSRGASCSDHPLTYANISVFAADIKSIFSAAIMDIKPNFLAMTEKMAAAETAGKHRDKAIHRLDRVASCHFVELNRHIEDLDNRGRRNNIRVRGIPESVETDEIVPALQRVFNSLLERQEDAGIYAACRALFLKRK